MLFSYEDKQIRLIVGLWTLCLYRHNNCVSHYASIGITSGINKTWSGIDHRIIVDLAIVAVPINLHASNTCRAKIRTWMNFHPWSWFLDESSSKKEGNCTLYLRKLFKTHRWLLVTPRIYSCRRYSTLRKLTCTEVGLTVFNVDFWQMCFCNDSFV